ncbi:MAG: CTP synthase [Magnetococcales bacterium]|nr:CTP synthase [Magnetococcales bacterium]
MIPVILIVGEFSAEFPPHQATNAAIDHSARHLGVEVLSRWLSSADITPDGLTRCQGLWIAPGSPYKNLDKTLQAIRYAREQGIPCLGTCGGFQHMILEYARNLLGFTDAQHAEYDPYASNLFVSRLSCSLAGREMWLRLQPGSRVRRFMAPKRLVSTIYCIGLQRVNIGWLAASVVH